MVDCANIEAYYTSIVNFRFTPSAAFIPLGVEGKGLASLGILIFVSFTDYNCSYICFFFSWNKVHIVEKLVRSFFSLVSLI